MKALPKCGSILGTGVVQAVVALARAAAAALLITTDPVAAQSVGAAEPGGGEPTIEFGGLLQVQWETGDRGDARFANDNDRFYLRRARLNAQGRFLEEFDFRLELDLAGTLANTSGLRAQVTDGFVNWNRSPQAIVRFGQFKTPFGHEQLFSDPRLVFLERSLVNDRLTVGRQLGVQVGGELADRRVTYAVGAFNGNGANNNFNDNDKSMIAGRFAAVPWRVREGDDVRASWSIGVNAYSSDDELGAQPAEFGFDATPSTAERDNLFTGQRRGAGIDSQWSAGPFEVAAEFLRVRWEPAAQGSGAAFESAGGYLQAAWSFHEQRFQVVAKIEQFDPRDDRDGDRTRTATAGFNWYLKGHDLKLMADVQRVAIDGAGGAGGGDDDQTKFLTRFQVAF
jgi:phosphate-selective porin OprO/OprP